MKRYEDEFELSAWYAQDRLKAMQVMTGSIGARKMVSVAKSEYNDELLIS